MLLSSVESGRRILSFGDRQVFVHSSDLPFITAIRREKTYEANRGTVKERVTEVERVPLADVSETGGGLTFSAKGHSVSVAVSELPDGVQLALSGEDGWAYEFRLQLPRCARTRHKRASSRGRHVRAGRSGTALDAKQVASVPSGFPAGGEGRVRRHHGRKSDAEDLKTYEKSRRRPPAFLYACVIRSWRRRCVLPLPQPPQQQLCPRAGRTPSE